MTSFPRSLVRRRSQRSRHWLSGSIALLAALGPCRVVSAEAEVFFDFAEWQSAMSSTTTIGFTGFPDGTLISNQYEAQGVVFESPHPFTLSGFDLFLEDGAGIVTNTFIQDIEVQWSQPQYGIATHFTGAIQFQLFDDNGMVYESDTFGVGTGLFVGFISTISFDRAVIFDPTGIGIVVIDDLHFGVPAPGALGLFALAGAIHGRRRRRH